MSKIETLLIGFLAVLSFQCAHTVVGFTVCHSNVSNDKII